MRHGSYGIMLLGMKALLWCIAAASPCQALAPDADSQSNHPSPLGSSYSAVQAALEGQAQAERALADAQRKAQAFEAQQARTAQQGVLGQSGTLVS